MEVSIGYVVLSQFVVTRKVEGETVSNLIVIYCLFLGHKPATLPKPDLNAGGDTDDWETDPDFVNDVTEEEQRWGSKTIEGSGRGGASIEYGLYNINQFNN